MQLVQSKWVLTKELAIEGMNGRDDGTGDCFIPLVGRNADRGR